MQVTTEGGVTSNAVMSRSAQPSVVFEGTKLTVAIVLAAWFALILVLGAGAAFASPPGTLPVPIALGTRAPIVLFLAGLWMSRPFREFVLAADLRFMAGMQAWRFAGLGFLALYVYGVLPGVFAWPAGLGDITVGVTAPWIHPHPRAPLRGEQDFCGVERVRITGPRRGA